MSLEHVRPTRSPHAKHPPGYPHAHAAGFTLAETLVAAAITLLLMTSLYQLFAYGGRLYLRGQTQSDLQLAGLRGLDAMAAEFRRSAFAYLTVSTRPTDTPKALSFRTQDPSVATVVTFNPVPYFTVYYLDATHRNLIRKTWGNTAGDPVVLTPSPLVLNARLTAAQLTQICTTPNGTERVVASSVDNLSATPATYPAVSITSNLELTLALSATVGSDTLTQSVDTTVAPRNKL